MAKPLLETLSRENYPIAMTFLGIFSLEGGDGFTKDTAEGLRLVRQAASAGDALAAVMLAGGYEFGREGLSKDEAEALRWYRKAADAGAADG
ncbi:MAG TPA: sel1 repeat family protein, partial [Methyloceanibacter sp.]